MNIDLAIQHKLALGQGIDLQFFTDFRQEHQLDLTKVQQLQSRWEQLINFKFLDVNQNDLLLEIQGHHTQFIDLVFLTSKQQTKTNLNLLEWQNLLNYLCLKNQISWNTSTPFASFSFELFSRPCRVTLIHQRLTSENVNCAKFFIRFHQLNTLPIENFILKKDQLLLAPILKKMVAEEKKNVLVCGATGSGKTTLLKSLAQFIPENEHLITLEDAAELFIQRDRLTSLQAQSSSNQNSPSEKTLDDLCSYVMRLTPERLILGEIRGREILTLSMMLNTGHQGLLTTVHASSAVNAVQRLAMLFCLYQQDGSSFSYPSTLKFLAQQFQRVIFLEDKIIKEVIKIIGTDQDHIFFETLYPGIDSK